MLAQKRVRPALRRISCQLDEWILGRLPNVFVPFELVIMSLNTIQFIVRFKQPTCNVRRPNKTEHYCPIVGVGKIRLHHLHEAFGYEFFV